MRVSRQAKLVGWTALMVLILFAGYIAFRFFTHGPPALERAQVTPPQARVRYGSNARQTFDVRVPAGRGPFPVVVLVHGGCWNTEYGGPNYMAPLADALRERGIATVNLAYRRMGEAGGGWPGTFRDVGAGVDAVRTIAPRFRLDPERLVVVGHSAGALLALWAAARDRLTPSSDLHASQPLMPSAVVAIDGPGALAPFIGLDEDICGKPAIVPLIGGTPQQVPRRYADATPQEHLPLGIPQYVIRGGLKQPADAYLAAARRSGDRVTFAQPSRATHFDVLMPWHDQGRTTLDLIIRATSETSPQP